jgi:CubicO group peptidase (beta-lactamase class C family)
MKRHDEIGSLPGAARAPRHPMVPFNGFADPAFAPVARCFAGMFRSPDTGGGSLVVRWRGRTVVDVWNGYADRQGPRPWTRDTPAISFSTTKGVASAVIHRLADRGLIGYDEPVAAYWPQFAAGGKGRITVRELLSHRAGLDNARAVAPNAQALLDHLALEDRLAAQAPHRRPGVPAYHGLTYGWLVAGLARRVTGLGMAELVRTELAEPLGVRGLHIGAPPEGRAAVAEPVGSMGRLYALGWVGARFRPTRRTMQALYVPGFDRLLDGPAPRLLDTEMPAANGVFTAESLATLYTALACGGEVDGVRLLSADTVRELGRVQTRAVDRVLGVRMRWRLGYHQAITLGRVTAPGGFGHFGYGGSGAWADPDTGLALAYVSNKVAALTTPMGDMGLFRLSGLTLKAAARAETERDI